MSEAFQPDHLLFRLSSQVSGLEKEDLRSQLVFYINHLLLNDFNQLVQLLYRVDVDEEKLKTLLHENSGTDASVIIADLLISRQEEKHLNNRTSSTSDDIPDEDRW